MVTTPRVKSKEGGIVMKKSDQTRVFAREGREKGRPDRNLRGWLPAYQGNVVLEASRIVASIMSPSERFQSAQVVSLGMLELFGSRTTRLVARARSKHFRRCIGARVM
jgi:hypothetical protein